MFAKITKRSLSPILATALAAIFVVSPAQAADPIVTNPSSIVDGSAGLNHAMAVTADGSVYAWGFGNLSGTGNLNSYPYLPEATKVEGLVGIKQISAAETHTLALDGSGAVWAWGDNYKYQLGRPAVGYLVAKPTKITTLPLMRKVYAAKYRSYAIDRQNNLWTWGYMTNQSYAVDTGTLPRMVLTGVDSIFPSEHQTLIVKRDGTLWGYGSNTNMVSRNQEWGNIDVYTPVQFDIYDVKQVVSRSGYFAALTGEGLVYEWGFSQCMAQPAGSYPESVLEPTLVAGLDNVTELYSSVVGCATYVKKADNTFWAWGREEDLPIANESGAYNIINTPVQILAGQNVQKLFTGYINGYAVTPEKFIGWGYNQHGMLYFQDN